MLEQSRAKVSSYAIRGCRLSRRSLLCESSFQPRDVFLEALVVFQQTLTGEEEDVVAELLITLKVVLISLKPLRKGFNSRGACFTSK